MTEKRLSHAYMLVAPEGAGRREEAEKLASALLCASPDAPCGRCRDCRKSAAGVHPDRIWLTRQKDDKGNLRREIYVDQIRAMTADAAVAPNESARKVYVIQDADRMNLQAQNALLKALEDPPGHACFILCTAAADALLPTVRSRCVRVEGQRQALPEENAYTPFAREYLALAAGKKRAALMAFCMGRAKLTREEMLELIESVRDELWAQACGRQPAALETNDIFRLQALMDRAEAMLRRNLGSRQVLGVLAAETLR